MSIILNYSITVKKIKHDSGEIKIINAGAAEEYAPTRRVSDKRGVVLSLVSRVKGRGAQVLALI